MTSICPGVALMGMCGGNSPVLLPVLRRRVDQLVDGGQRGSALRCDDLGLVGVDVGCNLFREFVQNFLASALDQQKRNAVLLCEAGDVLRMKNRLIPPVQ